MSLPRWIKVEMAAGDKPAKIHVRGIIGSKVDKETWTLTNTEEAVLNELNKVDQGKPVHFHINSKGGDVGLALGIYNAMRRRASDITTHNDGYALSSASILMLGGSKAVSPDSSVWMIHRASAGTYGNAKDKAKDAEMLETHDKAIAGIYAAKTGKSQKEMMDLMDSEKWMTGKEARDLGFADEDGEADPDEPDKDADVDDSEAEIIATFRNIPENLRSRLVTVSAVSGGNPAVPPRHEPTKISMKKFIEALAAKGITLPATATEDEILAAYDKMLSGNQAELQKHKDALKKRVEARVKKAVDDKRIKAERQDTWVARGLADESALDELDEIPTPTAAAPKPEKTPKGAPAVENDADPEATDVDTQIENLQNEILNARAKDGEAMAALAIKNGVRARKIAAARGDKRSEIQWVKLN